MLLAYAKYQAIAVIRFPAARISQVGATIHSNCEMGTGANGGPPWFLAESMDIGEYPMGARRLEILGV